MSDAAAANAQECRRIVEAADPDRAVSVLFAPEDRQSALLALYAFNIEIAKVRNEVSQPMPGEIRLQWWRDSIAAGDGGGHPVATELCRIIGGHELPKDAFDRMIEARIFDLYDDPMPDRTAFETYAGETASALIMLAAMILDPAATRNVVDAAGHAGVAQGAAGAMRLLPIHRARGQIYFPADLLSAVGASGDALKSGDEQATSRALAAMTAFAREHDAVSRKALIPASLRAAFLPARLTSYYLSAIERRGAKALGPGSMIGPFRRILSYWRAMRQG